MTRFLFLFFFFEDGEVAYLIIRIVIPRPIYGYISRSTHVLSIQHPTRQGVGISVQDR